MTELKLKYLVRIIAHIVDYAQSTKNEELEAVVTLLKDATQKVENM